MPFKPGEYVILHARVIHVYGADREEAYQTYGLQLSDGQGLQTNIANLEAVPAVPEPGPEPVAEPVPEPVAEAQEKAPRNAPSPRRKT